MEVCKTKKPLRVVVRAALAAILGSGITSSTAHAANPPIFDWSVDNASGNPNYTPAPVLTDTNVASVAAILAARPAGSPLAVKIVTPISDTTANTIFNTFKVNFVFADLEGSNALAQTKTLATQVKGSSKSSGASISEFNLYNTSNDPTRPAPVTSGAPSFPSTPFNSNDFKSVGINTVAPALYPGSPDFLSHTNSSVSFPNLRSAFFVLPIDRLTFATDMAALGTYPPSTPSMKLTGYQNIPWVARFNNYGNSALNNDAGFMGYKYAFNAAANNQYANQLPSAGDFSAQMLQYRLRGATSYSLFNYSQPGAAGSNQTYSSVIGYSVLQEQTDAKNGFYGNTGSGNAQNSTLGNIWGRNNYAFANLLNNVPISPGKSISASASGMVLSGIYDVSGSTRQLALMLSNMNSKSQSVDFWQKYGGASVDLNGATSALDQVYTIQPGTHQLLQFNLTGGKWVLFANNQIFADSNRNGVGVPEPTSIGILGLTALGLLLRRRRQPQL